MTTAVEHGTVTNYKYHQCKCQKCRAAYRDYQRNLRRKQAYGTWQPFVDANPVRAHLEDLHGRGMSWARIAKASGTEIQELRRLRMPIGQRPMPQRIRKEWAERLLAVAYSPAPITAKSLVDSTGTARRVQGLRAIGWPMDVLSVRSGVDRHTLAAVLRQQWVLERTRDAVAELYDDLHNQDPRRFGVDDLTVRRATAWASSRKWPAPNRWVPGTIDDPAAAPGPAVGPRYVTPSAGDRRQAVIEDTAELALLGYDRHAIAERLGVTWEAVQRAHRRAGVPVPRILTAA